MNRNRLVVGLVWLFAACGGGGGGPSGASGFPDVAGIWTVNQARVGGSCTQIPFSPFVGTVTRDGSMLRLVIATEVGDIVFFGTIREDGSFNLVHAGVLQGFQSQSTVAGQFNGNTMSADEEQVLALEDDPTVSCNILWQWMGTRG